MKLLLILSSFFLIQDTFGQGIYDTLRNITSIEDARQFLIRQDKAGHELFEISSDRDTSAVAEPLFSKSIGFTFTIDNFIYKIISIDSQNAYRASYIYLDGSQYPQEAIDSLRQVIITSYKTGTPFIDLVTKYSMDGNPTGDTHWFSENMMMPEFEEQVKAHNKGDIFTVDIPGRKWFYVVLKTFDDKSVKKLVLLKVKHRI